MHVTGTCAFCGSTFNFPTAAWGDEICGDCIAGAMERAFIRATVQDRKPLKRAASIEDAAREAASTLRTGTN
jgi:hypothetical protein